MPSTLKYNIVYPAGNVAPNVPLVMQAQAESAEAAIDTALVKYPQGLMTRLKGTANSSAVSALSVINNIPTFSFKAGRRYRIVWSGQYYTSVANSFWAIRIQSASTADAASLTTGLTQLQSRTISAGVASSSESFYVEAIYEPVSDVTLQIKFTVQNAAGGGTIVIAAGATDPALYYIEDMGKQF
jgi:hypothetical protein